MGINDDLIAELNDLRFLAETEARLGIEPSARGAGCLKPSELVLVASGQGVPGSERHLSACVFCRTSLEHLRKVMTGEPLRALSEPVSPDPTAAWIENDSPVTKTPSQPLPVGGHEPLQSNPSTEDSLRSVPVGVTAHTGSIGMAQPSRLDQAVRAGVQKLLDSVRREAVGHAYHALRRWNTRGVERFGAKSGWIFRKTRSGTLRSVTAAAVNTGERGLEIPIEGVEGKSIVAYVYRTGEGFSTGDVSKMPSLYLPAVAATRSELAVPIYGPNDELLGVYNLESDQADAFTYTQIRELKKKVGFLVPHLLVLKHAEEAEEKDGGWLFHPDVHGWNPEQLLTRFCEEVGELVVGRRHPCASCTLWCADPEVDRYWVLATGFYDTEFLTYPLDGSSAVARVMQRGQIERGTPHSLRFALPGLKKGERMDVRHAIIAPLRDHNGEGVRGTLNLYFFADRPEFPSDELVAWLAGQAERLIACLNRRRVPLALAHLRCQLLRAVAAANDFEFYRKAVLRILPADAMSIFGREAGTEELECIDTTGFERPSSVANIGQVRYDLVKNQHTRAAWLVNHPGVVLRDNWGPSVRAIAPGASAPPPPSNLVRERITRDTAYHRRSLATGVARGDSTRPDRLGMIRILRSGQGRPFTDAEARLFGTLAAAAEDLFVNWSFEKKVPVVPNLYSPTSVRIDQVLQGCVARLIESGAPALQASVFVRAEGTAPRYDLHAYHSPQYQGPPEEGIDPPTGELVGPDGWKLRHRIAVVEHTADCQQCRVYVPLMIWGGPHLIDALFAIDFAGEYRGSTALRPDEVFRSAVILSATWAFNAWRADRVLLDRGNGEWIRAFQDYLGEVGDGRIVPTSVRLRPDHRVPYAPPGVAACPDQMLARSGVLMSADASQCSIPLVLGPFQVADVLCELDEELRRLLVGTTATSAPEWVSLAWDALRQFVGAASGAWCRLVAGSRDLWEVCFSDDPSGSTPAEWWEHIRLREAEVPIDG